MINCDNKKSTKSDNLYHTSQLYPIKSIILLQDQAFVVFADKKNGPTLHGISLSTEKIRVRNVSYTSLVQERAASNNLLLPLLKMMDTIMTSDLEPDPKRTVYYITALVSDKIKFHICVDKWIPFTLKLHGADSTVITTIQFPNSVSIILCNLKCLNIRLDSKLQADLDNDMKKFSSAMQDFLTEILLDQKFMSTLHDTISRIADVSLGSVNNLFYTRAFWTHYNNKNWF